MARKTDGSFTTAVSNSVSQGSWVRYPVWQHTFVSPSAFSRRAVVSYWRKYVHEVLVNRLGDLSLPRKSVVRLTNRPDMTLDVYRGRKTTMQQKQLSCPTCDNMKKTFKGSKHLWLIYHGCFELVLKSLRKNPIAADLG